MEDVNALRMRLSGIKKGCYEHANDLIKGSRAVQAAGVPNVAYHLATLALEEIGKAGLMGMAEIANIRGESTSWFEKQALDHEKKLFWAFFAGQFGRRLNRKQLEEDREFARRVHLKRMQGLYVDAHSTELPRDVISPKEADGLIDLAAATLDLQMEKGEHAAEPSELTEEQNDLLLWFLRTMDDPLKSKMMFSRESMDKLGTVGSVHEWAGWLKDTIGRQDAENRALLEKELQRERPQPNEAKESKWKFRIRVCAASHSVRPKVLSTWNRVSSWINLISLPNKREFFLEFSLPKAIPVQSVWSEGLTLANRFIIALNIGTLGYFWWYLPSHAETYYERLEDLETTSEVKVSAKEGVTTLWERDQTVLSEADLGRVALCFRHIAGREDADKATVFNFYLSGLTLLGIHDVHYPAGAPGAFRNFYGALRRATEVYEECGQPQKFPERFDQIVSELLSDKAERSVLLELGERLERGDRSDRVTVEDAMKMKTFCDFYLIKRFEDIARSEMKET